MYPVLKEGVSIGTFQYEGSDTTHYYIDYIEMLLGGRDLKLASDCAMPS